MKKLVICGLVLVVVLVLAICSLVITNPHRGRHDDSSSISTVSVSHTPKPSPSLTGMPSFPDPAEASPSPNPYFVESEIYNEGGIVFTISNPVGTKSFDLRVENNSDYDISYRVSDLAINNFHVSQEVGTVSDISILAGRVAENTYRFYGLEMTDAASIKTVDMDIWLVRGYEQYLGIDNLHFIHAETSAYDGNPILYSLDNATLVYNDENVAIHECHDGPDMQDISFVYQNKTDKRLSVYSDDTVVNGLMASDWYGLWADLLPNCCYDERHPTGTVTLWNAFDDTVAEKDINPVQEIIVKFLIHPEGEEPYTTDEIVVYSADK